MSSSGRSCGTTTAGWLSTRSSAGTFTLASSSSIGTAYGDCSVMSVLLLVQLAAQLQHRFGVHLADAALRHAEHLADLRQRESLVVIEGDDDLLALGECVDRLGEQVLRLLRFERHDRVF